MILEAKGLGKYYGLYRSPLQRLRSLLGGAGQERGFWALRDISFSVAAGESFAIIGRNGGGKSTLLQLIAGVLQPTQGTLQVRGTVAALLELGSGFHPEFTGRENVFLFGDLHGVSRQDMAQRYEEIIEFADIGDFIEQPVKYYSSGMFVRLAFAVATTLSAQLLLIDEALAVGDVFFRQKCYDRLEALRRQGTAIVLVSHAMGEVQEFCQRALLLHEGSCAYLGEVQEAVNRYYLLNAGRSAVVAAQKKPAQGEPGSKESRPASEMTLEISPEASEVSDGGAQFLGISACRSDGTPCRVFEQGETLVCTYAFHIMRKGEIPVAGLVLRNDKNIIAHGKNSLMFQQAPPAGAAGQEKLLCRQEIQLNLGEGEYSVEVGLGFLDAATYAKRQVLGNEEVEAAMSRDSVVSAAAVIAVVRRKGGTVEQPMQITHHGLCDLPGTLELKWS